MAGAVSVEDAMVTEPRAKVGRNAPFDEKNVYNVRLTNNGAHRIGWAIKTTSMRRLAVEPPCGVLAPHEEVLATLTCEAFDGAPPAADKLRVEWGLALEGCVGLGRKPHHRIDLPVDYNP